MAKVSIVERNKKRERLVKKYSNRRQDLKKITSNRELPIEERFVASAKLAQLPRNGARNRVKLRCELTGRSRGNYRKFKLCRIALRELALSGKLPGVIKASW